MFPIRRTNVPRTTSTRFTVNQREDRLLPANLFVNTLADDTTADSNLSLREVMLLVNASGDANAALRRTLTAGELAQVKTIAPFGSGDTIQVEPSLTGGSTSQQDITVEQGQLPFMTKNFRIEGPGAKRLAIGGKGASRIFMLGTISASLSGLTLQISNDIYGGAILSSADLSISDCAVAENHAIISGGIANNGILAMVRSTVTGNTSTNDAGFIYANYGRTTLRDCTIGGNSSVGVGAITNKNSELELINTTVAANSAPNSSGIANTVNGTATLHNSVVAGNVGGVDFFTDENPDTRNFGTYNVLGNAPRVSIRTSIGSTPRTHCLAQ
jgi:hypothetical protein